MYSLLGEGSPVNRTLLCLFTLGKLKLGIIAKLKPAEVFEHYYISWSPC